MINDNHLCNCFMIVSKQILITTTNKRGGKLNEAETSARLFRRAECELSNCGCPAKSKNFMRPIHSLSITVSTTPAVGPPTLSTRLESAMTSESD